jgi:hypothetical protein
MLLENNSRIKNIMGFPPTNLVLQTNFYSYSFENKRNRLTNLLWLVLHREAITVKVCLYLQISWRKTHICRVVYPCFTTYLYMNLIVVCFFKVCNIFRQWNDSELLRNKGFLFNRQCIKQLVFGWSICEIW